MNSKNLEKFHFNYSKLKKKHDDEKKNGNIRQEELEKIKKEIEAFKEMEFLAEGPQIDMEERLANLKQELEDTKYKT